MKGMAKHPEEVSDTSTPNSEVDPHLIPCIHKRTQTKPNQTPKCRTKAMKLPDEARGTASWHWTGFLLSWQRFLGSDIKGRKQQKKKIEKSDFTEMKNICPFKDNINYRMEENTCKSDMRSEFNIQNCKTSYNSKTNNPLKKWAKDLLKFTACEMIAQGQGKKSSYCTSFQIQKMLNHEYTLFNQTLHSVFNALFCKLSRILLWSIIQMDILIVFTYQ